MISKKKKLKNFWLVEFLKISLQIAALTIVLFKKFIKKKLIVELDPLTVKRKMMEHREV